MKIKRNKGVAARLTALNRLLKSKRPRSALETACIRRLIRDFENEGQNGLVWNEDEAANTIEFCKLLRHWKGEWGGQKFVPTPDQEHCCIAPLFGWFREVGGELRRRFTVGYDEEPRKNGKMLALDTLVPTPTGWTTMGDVQVGDEVLSPEGHTCRVTWASPIDLRPESFVMRFSNGETVRACADHQWVTTARVDSVGVGVGAIGKRRSPAGQDCLTRTRTTREIYETQRHGSRGDRNHSLAMPLPIELPATSLPLDPYCLGAWLGDGNSSGGVITCSDRDWWIIGEIQRRGWDVVRRDNTGDRPPSAIIGRAGIEARREGRFRRALRLAGVLNNKHVPREYLRASKEQRIDLLQGLMDTDGSAAPGGKVLEFSNCCKPLVDGFCELLSTLGIKWTVTAKSMRCNRRDVEGVSYRVQFVAHREDVEVFRLPRKLDRQRSRADCRVKPRSRTVQIVDVTPCDPVPMRCISVDSPSRQFLVGRTMLPTHNTFKASAIALQGLMADGEPGAECYAAASTRDQASILFRDSQNCVRQVPELAQHLGFFHNSLTFHNLASFLKPVSSEANTLHGHNIHRAVIDEIHAQPNRDLWDVIQTGTGARRNPLVFGITTAGHDRTTICWELHEYARSVLEGHHADDTFFAYIACAEPEEDPFDPATWWKANPNLDISIKSDYLAREANKAKTSPSYENTFRRLHLNQWTEQAVRWLPMHVWDECRGPWETRQELEEALKGRECYAGLDLASNRDVNSLVLAFPFDDGRVVLLPFFWAPEEVESARAENDRRQVKHWMEAGLIAATEGNVTDYAQVVTDIIALSLRFEILNLMFDPWNAEGIVQQLQLQGFPLERLTKFPQTIGNFAGPTKELERLVVGRKLEHSAHPVLRWMASNVTVRTDPAGNIRPDKGKSSDKIDGIVASIMAVAGVMKGSEAVHTSCGLTILKEEWDTDAD